MSIFYGSSEGLHFTKTTMWKLPINNWKFPDSNHITNKQTLILLILHDTRY